MIDYATIARAKNGATLRSFYEMERKARLVDIVTRTAAIRNDKLDKGVAEVTAEALHDRLMQKYPAITFDEIWVAISEAFYSGRKVYRVNAVDLYLCVSDYVNSDEHKRFVYIAQHQARTDAPQLEAKHETQETIDNAARAMIRADFEMMKEHGSLLPPTFKTPRGTFCYDYLEKAGQIKPGAWTNYRGVPLDEPDKFAKTLDGTLPEETLAKYKCYIAYLKHITNKSTL